MTESIYGLNYEIKPNRDVSLLFTKYSPWMEHDLIPMEKSMLLSYPISRLLPLELNEMNLQISLAYKLGAKKSLSQLTHNLTIEEVDCLRILFTIVTTLVDSKVHLLNEDRYLLQESFIYVGTDYLDVHLIYLPIYEFVDKPPLPIELLNLLTFLLKKQGRAQSQRVREIKELLNAAEFQLAALKEKLLQGITEIESSFPASSVLDHDSQLPRHPSTPGLKDLMLVQSTESWLPLTAKEKFQNWRLQSSHNPMLIAATILCIGIEWVFYSYYSSVGMLNLCLGLSLLILNIGFWLNRSLGTMDTGELPNENPLVSSVEQQFPMIPAINYYEQLGNQTTLLAPMNALSDATVLLSPSPKAFLELRQGDETQLIKLSSDSFIIGRNEEAAQFTANWLGLSRSHIMITCLGNDYEVKDLGSKNGSFLNEESMIPHQNYRLNEGDCIKIVEKQFIYKKL